MTIRRIAIVAATSVLVLAGCAKGGTTSGAPPAPSDRGPAPIIIQATEFSFLMPDTIPAGVTTLHVQNVGGMPHFIEIQSVSGGHTDDDIQAILDDPKAPQPEWLAPAPVPNISLLSPGRSTDVTVDLPAGTYAAFCWMPDTNGTPHAFLGMHKVFHVTGTSTGGTLPTGDLAVTDADGSLQVPDTIPTGMQTISYANSGSKPAEITVARILVDEPIDQVKKDVDAWFGSGYAGPAPAEFLGGLSRIPANTDNVGTTTVNFTPGVYAFVGRGKTPPVIREVGGGGYPSPSASASTDSTASCAPASAEMSLTAENVAFDISCLAAPADQTLTIMFNNQDDGTTHNLAIYGEGDGSKALFTGELVVGPKTTTYSVDGLPAGTYRFQCDVHPTTMLGTLIVE
jgi:plastocyanin